MCVNIFYNLILDLFGQQSDYLVSRMMKLQLTRLGMLHVMPAYVRSITWSIPKRVSCSFISSI